MSNENGCLPWKKLFRRRRIEGKSRRAAGRSAEDRVSRAPAAGQGALTTRKENAKCFLSIDHFEVDTRSISNVI